MANRKRKSGRRSSARGDPKKGKMEEEEDEEAPVTEEESQEVVDGELDVVDKSQETASKEHEETEDVEKEEPTTKRKRSSSRSKSTNDVEIQGDCTSSSQESFSGSQSGTRRSSGRNRSGNMDEKGENLIGSQTSHPGSQGNATETKIETQDEKRISKSKGRRSSSRSKKAGTEDQNKVENLDIHPAEIQPEVDCAGEETAAMSDADDSIYHSAESTKDGATDGKPKTDEMTLAEELGIEDSKMDVTESVEVASDKLNTDVENMNDITDGHPITRTEAKSDSVNIVEMNELDVTDSQLCNFNEVEGTGRRKQEEKPNHENLQSGSAIIRDLMQDLADMNRLITRARNDLNATKARLSTKWQMTF